MNEDGSKVIVLKLEEISLCRACFRVNVIRICGRRIGLRWSGILQGSCEFGHISSEY